MGGGRLYFLDGLRGWAAVVVLLHHTFRTWLLNPEAMGQRDLTWLLHTINRTPLAFLTDGQLAVVVFFTISGAALSYPILVSSAPFRTLTTMAAVRYPRLTIPIAASSVLAFALVKMGWMFNEQAALVTPSTWLVSFYGPHQIDLAPFVLWRVYSDVPTLETWNAVLWTMPIELAGSFMLFGALIILPFRWLRLAIGAFAVIWYLDSFYCGFFAGYLLAEAIVSTRLPKSAVFTAGGIVLVASAIAGALLMHNRGIPVLNILSIALVTGGTLCPAARDLLSSNTSRFLGRISFSLYLVHLLVICSAGCALYLALEPHVVFPVLILIVSIATLVISIGAASLFEELVEARILGSVKSRIKHAMDGYWSAQDQFMGSTPLLKLVRHGGDININAKDSMLELDGLDRGARGGVPDAQ
jgi:peptidoglycan/LPS O-acetylase OafA/YrhL